MILKTAIAEQSCSASVRVSQSAFLFRVLQPGVASCHAPTLEFLDNDILKVAWFQGSRESAPDVGIWGLDMNIQKRMLSPPSRLFKVEEKAHWNPVLFMDQKDKLHMFFKVGEEIDSWQTFHSTWNGSRWGSAKKLSPLFGAGGRGPVRSKPIVLRNGNWLAPASIEKTLEEFYLFDSGRYAVEWKAFVDTSSNMGKSWRKSHLIDFDRAVHGEPYYEGLRDGDEPRRFGGVIQPTLWQSAEHSVHMFLRSTAGYVFRSDSIDEGRTWCQAYPTEIPNNNSGMDVCRGDNGLLCMAYNPVRGNWAARTPLSVSFSYGEGKLWTAPIHIAEGMGSFAYPTIAFRNGVFWVVYSWNRICICMTRIEYREGFIDEIKEMHDRANV